MKCTVQREGAYFISSHLISASQNGIANHKLNCLKRSAQRSILSSKDKHIDRHDIRSSIHASERQLDSSQSLTTKTRGTDTRIPRPVGNFPPVSSLRVQAERHRRLFTAQSGSRKHPAFLFVRITVQGRPELRMGISRGKVGRADRACASS